MGISLSSLALKLSRQGAAFYAYDSKGKVGSYRFLNLDNLAVLEIGQVMRKHQITDLVITPAVKLSDAIVKAAREVEVKLWNDLSLFLSIGQTKKYIGFTGTFGKSTAVDLFQYVYNILSPDRVQMGGNIGIPIFDCDPSSPIVIEFSAQQLELIPDPGLKMAVFINFYRHHMDRYTTIDEYFNNKFNIMNNATIKIANYSIPGQHVTISTQSPEAEYYLDCSGRLYEKNALVGILTSNRLAPDSVIAAYAALRCHDLPPEKILNLINIYPGLSHRCEIIKTNPLIVNDSKATSLINSIHCIQKFHKVGSKLGWIGGGNNQKQDLEVLEQVLDKISYVATIGSSRLELYSFLLSKRVEVKHYTSLKEAYLSCINQNCNIILFSPGYASTEEFQSFAQRGDCFRSIVVNNNFPKNK